MIFSTKNARLTRLWNNSQDPEITPPLGKTKIISDSFLHSTLTVFVLVIGPAGCDSCQNITSFRTPHNNFKTLPLPSKLQREKRKIKVVSNTRSIVVFRLTFLLLFFRGSFAGNRRRRIPAVSRFKLKSTKHRQQNAPCYVRLFFFRRKSFTFALRQEPITWSLQPLCIFVTAFSQTRLFLV